MAAKYWIKLYQEMLYDPKMGLMSDRLYRRTIELFLLAGETDEGGYLPTVEEMAWKLRLDAGELEQDLIELQKVDIVSERDGRWFVNKFAERQAAVNVTERSKQFRKREQSKRYSGTDVQVIGIYKIECLANHKIYIGSSIDCHNRIKRHFYEAGELREHWMRDDLLQYGRDQFRTEILEQVEDESELPERETYWIRYFQSEKYNTEKLGKRHRDRERTEVQRNVAQITEEDTDKDAEEEERRVPPAASAFSNGDAAATKIYTQVTGHMTFPGPIPEKIDAEQTIRQIIATREDPVGYLMPFWDEWQRRQYSPTNTAWLTSWAATGVIPPPRKKAEKPASQRSAGEAFEKTKQVTEEWLRSKNNG